MSDLYVKIGREKVKIQKSVFLALLDASYIKEYAAYAKAVTDNEINFADLKNLSSKAGVPYPLFFAPKNKIDVQLKDQNQNLFKKLPSKKEMQLSSRGKMSAKDIEVIVKDLGRKQEFLKNRILLSHQDNDFIGCVARKIKVGASNKEIAQDIRGKLGINLAEVRAMSKDNVLIYLRTKAEDLGVLVSFSSYNYMPQNIDRAIGLSGLCVKDKKFPYIFINTRDGDDKPLIIESSGRQIFTLLAMLVCIAMNKFILNTKTGKVKNDSTRRVYSIVGEILILKEDVSSLLILNIDELKKQAQLFRVTPSMLLMRLLDLKLISRKVFNYFKDKLIKELSSANPSRPRQPLPTTGYAKYNGNRLSREVIKAYKSNKITQDEVKNILFRRNKMDADLFREYSLRFE